MTTFTKTVIAGVIGAAIWCSCQESHAMSLRNKRETTSFGEQARGTANNSQAISAVMEGQKTPPASVSVTGTNNTTTLNVIPTDAVKTMVNANQEGKMAAQTNTQEASSSEVRLPLGVAIAIGCVGLALLVFAYILFVKLTAAGKAADALAATTLKTADTGFGAIAGIVESKLHTSTDPHQNALLSAILNAVNKERGKLNK